MKKLLVFLVVLVLAGTAAWAQNEGDFGLVYQFSPGPQTWVNTNNSELDPTFNYESSQKIGMIYHFTDQVAIMPMLLVGYVKTEAEAEPDNGDKIDWEEESLLYLGMEVDVPIYLKRLDNVAVFLAPGLRIASANNDLEITRRDPSTQVTTKLTEIGGRLTLGSQATFGRFGVLASWGLRFDHVKLTQETQDAPDPDDDGELIAKGPAFGTTQLSIGLVYYIGGE